MKHNSFRQRGLFAVLAALALSYLYPWLYMLLRSFMRHEPGLSDGNGLFTLDFYRLVLGNAGFPTYLYNSFFVLTIVLAANVVFSVTVGYAFARYRFPFRKPLFWMVLITLMVPKQTLMIPLLDLMVRLGLHDTLWALILPFCVDGFNLFLMKQYIEGLPPDLEDAARADGASEIAILRHVVVPLSRPAIAVLIINTAIINWNSFLFPLILTDTASVRTLPVALAMFAQGPYATDWGALMAGASVSSLPIIAIFWLFQKEIIEGITSGALKD
ncbi:MAG TPA: carbohydrate ABC transporter permease [Candidatus Riflebacteria bacterium]|jgi:multiple sugar transport system permease protein|nr:MAG: carbohydrate ABC transporter permease [Candidatus Riflebacteria bacterium HGW-Riflebacteria-1]HAE38544.1 carbohydrate ABC transporter permease [Candidatus Riflebacteria bacterium]